MAQASLTANNVEQHSTHVSYLPGLDGLRALAVISVMLYHAGYKVAGGYLGVESFFVLSGFLITALLFAEWQQHGTIHIRMFWLRRARRLLPALFVTLTATLLLAAGLFAEELQSLANDVLASLLYVINWKLIVGQQSYFDAMDRPSLLQHLWSLAVEEQFYVLWPLLFTVGMRALRPKRFLVAVLLAAAASTLLMMVLYDPGSDPSRVYYGTDTRASAVLFGAALALVWTPERRASLGHQRGIILEASGIVALLGLLAGYGWLYEQHPLLYYGGFQLVALATVLVIAATTFPGARVLPQLLELAPLRWIGLRSYSLYLWHWPIFLVTRPGIDLPWNGWPLHLARFGLITLLAALSYQFIEQPIRKHGFLGAWNELRAAIKRVPPFLAPFWRPITFALVALLVGTGGVVVMMLRLTHAAPPGQAIAILAPTTLTTPQALSAASLRPTEMIQQTPTADVAGASSDQIFPQHVRDDELQAQAVLPSAQPASPPLSSEPALDPVLINDLQNLLDDMVADGFVPGAVLSVSVPGYAPWVGASGLADRDQGRAMEPDTPIRIASVSKMFTAVVVMQLAEEGRITLDAPIATWLPDSIPRADAITVRQLLQHTSGLYDYLEDRNFVAETQREPERVWEPQELVAYASRFPSRAVGRWDYSSTNYVLLGMLVEQVTGQTLAQEMRQRVFEPLRLEHTVFLPQEPVPEALAHGYTKGTDITNASMSFAFATGSIASTAEDPQRFGRALFSEELVTAETRQQMLQFVSGRGQYDMPDLEYGLGIMRNRLQIGSDPRSLVLGHIGGYGGFRAALWYAPESDVVIAVSLNQAQTDPNDLAADVLARTLDYFRAP